MARKDDSGAREMEALGRLEFEQNRNEMAYYAVKYFDPEVIDPEQAVLGYAVVCALGPAHALGALHDLGIAPPGADMMSQPIASNMQLPPHYLNCLLTPRQFQKLEWWLRAMS